jgi:hypothetical protein
MHDLTLRAMRGLRIMGRGEEFDATHVKTKVSLCVLAFITVARANERSEYSLFLWAHN